jgi:uncharacterized protein (UPF0335 family)
MGARKVNDPAEPDGDLYNQAVALVRAEGNCSTSFVQRRMALGYNAAARLIERMEESGVVSKANHVGKRTLLPEPTISISTPDGKTTGPVPMSVMKQALEKVARGPHADTASQFPPVNDHNYAVAADELRQFIERFEQFEAEKKDIAEQQKDLMGEAKGRGYDTKIMRKIVALRKRKPDDIAEEEAVTEMYKAALGMA